MATVVEVDGGAKGGRAWAIVDGRGETVSVTRSFRHAVDAACCHMSGGWGLVTEAAVGMAAVLEGWGEVTALEVVVGDYRSTTRRYVRCACPASSTGWVLITETAFLKAQGAR